GIARIRGSERAVHDFDAFDFRRSHHAPPWSSDAVVVGDERGQQYSVAEYKAARARTHAPNTAGECRLRIAGVALPYEKTRRIFQGIFRIHDVDCGAGAFGGDAGAELRALRSVGKASCFRNAKGL